MMSLSLMCPQGCYQHHCLWSIISQSPALVKLTWQGGFFCENDSICNIAENRKKGWDKKIPHNAITTKTVIL